MANSIFVWPGNITFSGTITMSGNLTINGTFTMPAITFTGGSVLEGSSTNIVEQRNGTSAQSLYLYNTYTSSTSYERGEWRWTTNECYFVTDKGSGGGTGRVFHIGTQTSHNLYLRSNGSDRWIIDGSGGHLLANDNGLYDLGGASNKARSLYLAGYYLRSVGNALTAAGNNRATALQLAAEVNNLTTVAATTGVLLPVGVVGMRITIFNAGANLCQVYATASETIDTVAGSTGVALTNAKRCDYLFVAANTWISAQLGVISA